MEFTSGELLYRINVDSYKNGFPEISTEFWDFLNEELTNNPIDNSSNFNNTTYKIHSDDQTNRNSSSNSYSNNYTVTNSNSDGNSYNNTNAKSINNSSTISSNIIETYKTKINQYQKLLITIKTIINKNKNEFEYEKTRLHTQLLLLKQKYDGCLMELTLEYYNIIMSELYTTKQQVLCEQRDVQLLYKHAKILRDIEMFSVHLSLETKKNVTLVLLPNDSQQFNRCCKAVMDNIKPVLFGESPNNSYASPNKSGNSYSNSGDKSNHDTMNLMNNTRILNVFKLQNNYLANNLTELSKTITTGKIKGLFCNFLPNRLQTFSVFGLSSQKLPVDNYSDIKSLGSQYFRKPWFYYSPKHLQENNDTENGTRAGIYTPRATNNIHNQQEINNLTKVQGTAAKLSMKKHNDLILRFSRHSASENLYKYSDSDLETGVILALCRVLIVNQMTISETITDEHIIQAYEKNCDALYSTLTEEYVLFEPKLVLPEFFMHVQFPRLHNTTEDFDTTIDNLWLPPQFDSSTALHDEIALASSSLTTLATSVGKSGPVSALNPLQTNMLPCDVLCRNQLNAAPNLTISQNISIANKNTSLSSPRSALMKKQAIVVKVEKSIENFRQEKFELLRGHMNLLFNNLT